MKKFYKIVICTFFICLIFSQPISSAVNYAENKPCCDAVRADEAKNWPSVIYCSKPVEETNYDGTDARVETFSSGFCNGGYPLSCNSESSFSEGLYYADDDITSIYFDEKSFGCTVTAFDPGRLSSMQKRYVETVCSDASTEEKSDIVWSNWEFRTGEVETFYSPGCPDDKPYPVACLTKTDLMYEPYSDDVITSIFIEEGRCAVTAFNTDPTVKQHNRTVGVVCSDKGPTIKWTDWKKSEERIATFQSDTCPSGHPIACLTDSKEAYDGVNSIYIDNDVCKVTAHSIGDSNYHERRVGVVCSNQETFKSSITPSEDRERDARVLGYHHFFYVNKPENSEVWANHDITMSGNGVNKDNFNLESLNPGYVNPETGEEILYPVAEWASDGQAIKILRSGVFVLSSTSNHEILLASDDRYVRFGGTPECEDLIYTQTVMESIQASKMGMEKFSSFFRMATAFQSSVYLMYPLIETDFPINVYNQIHGLGTLPAEQKIAIPIGWDDVAQPGINLKYVLYNTEEGRLGREIIQGPETAGIWNGILDKIGPGKLYKGVEIIHNHPGWGKRFESQLSQGIPIDEQAIPSAGYNPNTGELDGDIAAELWLFERAQQKGVDPNVIGIGVVGRPLPDNPTLIFRSFKIGISLEEWHELVYNPRNSPYFRGLITNQDTQRVQTIPSESLIRSGILKETHPVTDGDKLKFLDGPPPVLEDYELNSLRLDYAGLGYTLNDNINDILSNFEGLTPRDLNLLNNVDNSLDRVIQSLDNSILSMRDPSSAHNLKDMLYANKQFIEYITSHGFDPNDINFHIVRNGANYKTLWVAENEVLESFGSYYRILQNRNAQGIQIPDSPQLRHEVNEAFYKAAQDAIEQSQIINNIHLNKLARFFGTRWQNLKDIKYMFDLSYAPVAAKISGFIPGFLIGFGLGLQLWSQNFRYYFAYELNVGLLMMGLDLMLLNYVGFGFSFLIILLKGGALAAIALAGIAQFVIASIIFLAAGIIIGFIASLFFVLVLMALSPSCETEDEPWYLTAKTDYDPIVNSGEKLNYAYYGLRGCKDRFVFIDYYVSTHSFCENFDNDRSGCGNYDFCSWCGCMRETETTVGTTHYECIHDMTRQQCDNQPDSARIKYYWAGCEFSKEGSKQAVTCNSQNGRCIDCQTNVNVPGGDYLLTFYLSDRDGFIANNKPLRVCSSEYTADIDQGSNKCVACDETTHKEIQAEFGDIPDDECESADFNTAYGDSGKRGTYCTASLECDERSPGSWYKGNSKKTCDSNCQYSEEFCMIDADLNDDGKVNIVDISIVAKAFGSNGPIESQRISASPNWNHEADLNYDNAVNIIDISIVAKDFGKTC